MITEKQVKALAFIIEQAKGDAWCVPTARKVAEAMYPSGKAITPGQERAVCALIMRLADTYKAFVKKYKGRKRQKRWFVNTRMFVTEPTSASYILCLHRMCHAPGNHEKSVKREDLNAAFRGQHAFNPTTLDRVLLDAKRADYIEETPSVEGQPLRVGHATVIQLHWIEYLASLSAQPKR